MATWLLLLVQLVLSSVLLVAGLGKVIRADEFAAALRVSHFSARLVSILTISIPTIELGTAAALVLSPRWLLPAPLGGAAALLGAFTGWMVWVRARRLRPRCRCFGVVGADVGVRSMARNLLLLLVALVGLILVLRAPSPLPTGSVWFTLVVSSVGLSVALLLVLWSARPRLVLSLDELARVPDPTASWEE